MRLRRGEVASERRQRWRGELASARWQAHGGRSSWAVTRRHGLARQARASLWWAGRRTGAGTRGQEHVGRRTCAGARGQLRGGMD
jgi:hypothetical protein